MIWNEHYENEICLFIGNYFVVCWKFSEWNEFFFRYPNHAINLFLVNFRYLCFHHKNSVHSIGLSIQVGEKNPEDLLTYYRNIHKNVNPSVTETGWIYISRKIAPKWKFMFFDSDSEIPREFFIFALWKIQFHYLMFQFIFWCHSFLDEIEIFCPNILNRRRPGERAWKAWQFHGARAEKRGPEIMKAKEK